VDCASRSGAKYGNLFVGRRLVPEPISATTINSKIKPWEVGMCVGLEATFYTLHNMLFKLPRCSTIFFYIRCMLCLFCTKTFPIIGVHIFSSESPFIERSVQRDVLYQVFLELIFQRTLKNGIGFFQIWIQIRRLSIFDRLPASFSAESQDSLYHLQERVRLPCIIYCT
jgi:hypothetical protein